MGQGSRGSARSLESLDPRLRGNVDQEASAPAFAPAPKLGADRAEGAKGRVWRHARSDGHTSETQSLMRIPYAVFCWKKTIYIDPSSLPRAHIDPTTTPELPT